MNIKQLKKLKRYLKNKYPHKKWEVFANIGGTRVHAGLESIYIECKKLWKNFSHNNKSNFWRHIDNILQEVK